MDILNKKERLNAFLLFLLMFFITTGVLITAIFFNFKLPLKENEVLKNENDKMNSQFNFNKEFTLKMEDIGKLVDSLDKAPLSFQFIEQSIGYELKELSESIPKDSTINPALYQNIIITTKEFVNTKKRLLLTKDSEKEIENLKRENESLKEDNKSLERNLQALSVGSRFN
ncbi:type VI secretion system transmembrane protein TssO [Flavobacterium jejuense]|uniref:Type VI secretion system transmembrane protein TssO n=1 Tax=Flavobacterium jejuense TaxID=1544455 RepID=A0ABX0IYH4_9FLAO|nr:type VI secretion system TssO [Flavobacterium jejuense]NHN27613.1 type VI secretion system transmembrane protein TssO [Flavobacterium jejuense]